MTNNIFNQVYTALVTPYCKDNKIDFHSLESLIFKQIDAKIKGVVIAGSTGEGNLLSRTEYINLIEFCTRVCQKKLFIIASITAFDTACAIELIHLLNTKEIDGIMCSPPCYLKLDQASILQYFRCISEASIWPVMLYNVPSRTASTIELDTVMALSDNKNIMAIKDTIPDCFRILQMTHTCEKNNFNVLCGDDINVLNFYANGAKGIVSVISNIAPKMIKKIHDLYATHQCIDALKLHHKLMPLHECLAFGTNPVVIKFCMQLKSMINSNTRSSLVPINSDTQSFICAKLQDLLDQLE